MQSANLQLLLFRLQGNSNGGLLHPLSTAGKVSRLEPLRPTLKKGLSCCTDLVSPEHG